MLSFQILGIFQIDHQKYQLVLFIYSKIKTVAGVPQDRQRVCSLGYMYHEQASYIMLILFSKSYIMCKGIPLVT